MVTRSTPEAKEIYETVLPAIVKDMTELRQALLLSGMPAQDVYNIFINLIEGMICTTVIQFSDKEVIPVAKRQETLDKITEIVSNIIKS